MHSKLALNSEGTLSLVSVPIILNVKMHLHDIACG